MMNYKEIFDKAEKTLQHECQLSNAEFELQYGRFKKFENKRRTDQEIFEMLVMIIFYSGFKASTVERKKNTIIKHFSDYKKVSKYDENDVKEILADPEMIRNERKIKACITNAKIFLEIITKYNSFQDYLDSFDPNASFDNLGLLREELEHRFEYIGSTTVYHFLTDLGFEVLKPDRVILRIFRRLGLIESEKQLLKAVIEGRRFANETSQPIRYIDIIFVKYGQKGSSDFFGLKDGICLERNPNCMVCGLTDYCNEFKKKEFRA